MQFNSEPNKPANEVIFSRKLASKNLSHPRVKFINNNITRCSHQKHLGVVLNSNLNFNTHIDQKIKKCNKMIGLIRQLSVNLPRNALLTKHKSFIRPHLDWHGRKVVPSPRTPGPPGTSGTSGTPRDARNPRCPRPFKKNLNPFRTAYIYIYIYIYIIIDIYIYIYIIG